MSEWTNLQRRTWNGYEQVYLPEHPGSCSKGWVFVHRLVAERKLGRLLRPGETVHHVCDKTDNRPEALIVCTREEHDRAHDAA